MKTIGSFILNALSVAITAYLLPGITVEGWPALIVATLVLAFFNTAVRPVLKLLAFPISLLTLGLFNLVINGLMVWLTAVFVPGFQVDGFLWAVLFSLVLSLTSMVLGWFGKS